MNRGSSCYAFITDAPDGWTEAEVINLYILETLCNFSSNVSQLICNLFLSISFLQFYCNLMHSRLVEIESVVEDEFLRLHLMDSKLTGTDNGYFRSLESPM